jgi:orotidine-5'-phosphate decarboxylase
MAPAVIVSESRSILTAGSGMIDSVVEDHARAARAAGEPRGSEGQEQERQ